MCARRAPGPLPACIDSEERIKVFLRCLLDTSPTILRWFSARGGFRSMRRRQHVNAIAWIVCFCVCVCVG